MTIWREVRLGDACRLLTDGDWIETKDQGGRDFRLMQVSNIGVGRFVETGKYRYITQETFDRLRCTEVVPGMVLVARMPTPIGRAWFVSELTEPAITAVDVAILHPDPSILDSRFCAYALNQPSQLAFWDTASSGTTRARITRRQLTEHVIRLPPLDEQRRIAHVLGAIDELIETCRRRVLLLEQMVQAIYTEWFMHFNYPGHESEELADSPIGPIPKTWEALSVSDAVDINPSVRAPRGAEVPFVAMADLVAGLMAVEPGTTREFGTGGSRFARHDTLFARITPSVEHGKTGFVQFLNDGEVGMGSTEFLIFRGKRLSSYSTYLLARRADLRKHAIASMFGASGRQRVNNTCFDTFVVAVPPAALDERFSSVVSPMFMSVEVLVQELRRLEQLRDILLPKLVTGAIDASQLDLDALAEDSVA